MTRIKYLMFSSVLVILSAFLINCSAFISQPDEPEQTDPEPDPQEELEATEEEQDSGQADGLDTEPFPGSSFGHDVNIKVNGIVEENKGEEWWVID